MAALQKKSVLVLGGSRGIGAAIVRRFAADGASVVFSYAGSPDAAAQLSAETGSVAVQTDSADREAVIKRVRDSGPLDVLVVNAGIALFGDALELDSDAVDRLFRINIHAPYHAAVEAARQMPDGGRIIIIGSVNGDRMPVPGMASYAVSKSALQGLARGLARDFGPRGITVNVVQPGPIDTDANPGKRSDERADAQLYGHQTARASGRGGGHGRLAGGSGSLFRDRGDAHHRRRVWRIVVSRKE